MAIKVQFKDNSFDSVPEEALDALIDTGAIVAFRRWNGWVEIGVDPVRAASARVGYQGPERRGVAAKKNCLTCSEYFDSACMTSVCTVRTSKQTKHYNG